MEAVLSFDYLNSIIQIIMDIKNVMNTVKNNQLIKINNK